MKLMSEWIGHFDRDNDYHGLALKVVMVLPGLLLQKPSLKSKIKVNVKILEER